MNKPTIVLLSAWKGSGKDTVADYLVKEFGYKRLGFADPLKDLVHELFPNVARHYLDVPKLKEQPIMFMPVTPKDGFSKLVTDFMAKEFKTNGFPGSPDTYWTPRSLAILVGSCMRSVNPNFWVEKALSQCEPGGKYVIADCRYKNEAEVVKASGANVLTVRIHRFEESTSVDPSEHDMDDYQYDSMMDNKGTVEELYAQVKIIEGYTHETE